MSFEVFSVNNDRIPLAVSDGIFFLFHKSVRIYQVMQKHERTNQVENFIISANQSFRATQSPAIAGNRVETLKVLSKFLLHEIEALKKNSVEILCDTIDLAKEVQRYEEDLIRSALFRTNGNQHQAAKILNVKVTTLNAKIKRYGILYVRQIEPNR